MTSSQTTRCVGQTFAARALLFLCVVGLVCLLGGCGENKDAYGVGKTLPVSGKVTHGGKPLTSGFVTFVPDSAKGNTSTVQPVGTIDEQGNYTVSTGTKPGAPPGAYKVLVQATVPVDPKNEYSPTKSILPNKYGEIANTPLSVQVAANAAPGAYDLTLE